MYPIAPADVTSADSAATAIRANHRRQQQAGAQPEHRQHRPQARAAAWGEPLGGDFEVGRLLAALGRRLGVGGVGVGLDAVALRARDRAWQTSRSKQPSEGEDQASFQEMARRNLRCLRKSQGL